MVNHRKTNSKIIKFKDDLDKLLYLNKMDPEAYNFNTFIRFINNTNLLIYFHDNYLDLIDKDNNHLISEYIRINNLEMIKYLIEKGYGFDQYNLFNAIDNKPIFEYLLSNGGDINWKMSGETYLEYCIRYRYFDSAIYLMSKGAKAASNNLIEILSSSFRYYSDGTITEQLKLINLLVQNGAIITTKVMIDAIKYNHTFVINRLFTIGVDPNIDQKLLFHHALLTKNLDIIRIVRNNINIKLGNIFYYMREFNEKDLPKILYLESLGINIIYHTKEYYLDGWNKKLNIVTNNIYIDNLFIFFMEYEMNRKKNSNFYKYFMFDSLCDINILKIVNRYF